MSVVVDPHDCGIEIVENTDDNEYTLEYVKIVIMMKNFGFIVGEPYFRKPTNREDMYLQIKVKI